MTMIVGRRAVPIALFTTLVLVAYVAAVAIVRSAPFSTTPTLAAAVSLDLTVGVFVVGWVLLVRRARLPLVTLAGQAASVVRRPPSASRASSPSGAYVDPPSAVSPTVALT